MLPAAMLSSIIMPAQTAARGLMLPRPNQPPLPSHAPEHGGRLRGVLLRTCRRRRVGQEIPPDQTLVSGLLPGCPAPKCALDKVLNTCADANDGQSAASRRSGSSAGGMGTTSQRGTEGVS